MNFFNEDTEFESDTIKKLIYLGSDVSVFCAYITAEIELNRDTNTESNVQQQIELLKRCSDLIPAFEKINNDRLKRTTASSALRLAAWFGVTSIPMLSIQLSIFAVTSGLLLGGTIGYFTVPWVEERLCHPSEIRGKVDNLHNFIIELGKNLSNSQKLKEICDKLFEDKDGNNLKLRSDSGIKTKF